MKKAIIILIISFYCAKLPAQFYLGAAAGWNKTYIIEQSGVKFNSLSGYYFSIPAEWCLNDQLSIVASADFLDASYHRDFYPFLAYFEFEGNTSDFYLENAYGFRLSSSRVKFNFYLQTQVYGSLLLGTIANGNAYLPVWIMGEFEGDYDTIPFHGWQNNGEYFTYNKSHFSYGIRPGTGFSYYFGNSALALNFQVDIGISEIHWFFLENDIPRHQNNLIATISYSYAIAKKPD